MPYLKILGYRLMTRSNFSTQDPQILCNTVQNLFPKRPGDLCTFEVEWSLFHTYAEIWNKSSSKNINEIMLEFHKVIHIRIHANGRSDERRCTADTHMT